jgi:PKD repeat protein
VGKPAHFTAAEGGDTSYKWAFGDGRTGYGQEIAHRYKRAGKYLVTLRVRDGGVTASSHRRIFVRAKSTTAQPRHGSHRTTRTQREQGG